jgi:hypothetical protein
VAEHHVSFLSHEFATELGELALPVVCLTAKAQFILIGEGVLLGINQEAVEALVSAWLKITERQLKARGYAGKELTEAANSLAKDGMDAFDAKERARIRAKLKTLRTPLRLRGAERSSAALNCLTATGSPGRGRRRKDGHHVGSSHSSRSWFGRQPPQKIPGSFCCAGSA